MGHHLVRTLEVTYGSNIYVIPTAKAPISDPSFNLIETLDVTCRLSVDNAIKRYNPTHIIHLAGIASPVAAAKNPDLAWQVHLQGTRNIAHSILANAPECTLINAGSGLIYGESAKVGHPLDETTVPAPLDEYGASKAAADLALGALGNLGLRVFRMRPFNHIGAGQTEEFVATAFAMQIARIEAGIQPPIIEVGNLNAERDFLDVRDVASAYAKSLSLPSVSSRSLIYNIGSGKACRIADLLQKLVALSSADIDIRLDPARQRQSDVPIIVANAQKARNELNWRPRYSLEETLAEVLADCRKRVATQTLGSK
ncbi:GDP-D-mannose dehydratase [Nitratireductor basaltis]|uniref:GDP-D-mannose dehydratase n=1 Tax=Nitratireductor basaltis TaxID=472175 RepID=A0A084UD00_9HYPH|nr:GDP-D-mannose dehydratase [Nitratireductor basaltis]